MTNLAKLYGTSSKLEQEGIDLHVGGEAYITIRRAGGANRAFLETFRRVTAPHRKAIERGALDAETDDALGIEIFAQCVVLGWRGVTNGDDHQIPFSREAFVKLMTELPELWHAVRDAARDAGNFREQEVADAGKSSASA